jgi:hypothetical protein
MIAGVLCQRKSIPSIYALDANFDVFPFVDDAGHFTIENNGAVVFDTDHAAFNKTSGQNLRFIGSETFNLQQNIEIECKVRNNALGEGAHWLFELIGSSSYLGLGLQNNAGYKIFLTGATGGNTDNYDVFGNLSVSYENYTTVKINYDATAGTLKIYINGVLDIDISGITPRLNEPRVMYLSGQNILPLKAWVDYFRVKVG